MQSALVKDAADGLSDLIGDGLHAIGEGLHHLGEDIKEHLERKHNKHIKVTRAPLSEAVKEGGIASAFSGLVGPGKHRVVKHHPVPTAPLPHHVKQAMTKPPPPAKTGPPKDPKKSAPVAPSPPPPKKVAPRVPPHPPKKIAPKSVPAKSAPVQSKPKGSDTEYLLLAAAVVVGVYILSQRV